MRDSPFSELHMKIAALTAEADQAQAKLNEARRMDYQPPELVAALDRKQMKLNVQRAEIRNLQSQVDILDRRPL